MFNGYNEIEAYKAQIRELKQHIDELTHDLEYAKRIAENKRQAEFKLEREVFRELTNGWCEVSEAYVLSGYDDIITCPICKDKGKISRMVDGVTLKADCPICLNRNAPVLFRRYEVRRLAWNDLSALLIAIDKSGNVYPSLKDTWTMNLNTCYKTIEEAQAEADRLSAENLAKAKERLQSYIEGNGYDKLIGSINNE
ncbi:MAG: hypothetical protein ACI3XQ_07835 [Eubacteriales bacterium]